MANTDWLKEAKYGISCGIGAARREELETNIKYFDTELLAESCQKTGAAYVLFTMAGNSGFVNAPNAAYDRYTGSAPGERCSKRDLILDLFESLNKRGMKLLLYVSGMAPKEDEQAAHGLGCERQIHGKTTDWEYTEAFVKAWSEVIQEFSDRYGKKVSGWWIDGCYDWTGFTDNIAEAYNSAVKHGNPESLLALNPGIYVPIISRSKHEDFTAGEVDGEFPASFDVDPNYRKPITRFVDGAQFHIFTFSGEHWAAGKPRFPDEFVVGYTKYIISLGGVITWDLPQSSDGIFTREAINQMIEVKKAIR
jgi:alpha-L-fucosidase